MERNRIIIIVLLIIIIVILSGIIMVTFMGNSHAYKNFTCNDTGTVFEVPVDLKVRQDMSAAGIRSTVMSTADGNIVIERQVGNNPYIDDTMEGASDLLNSYDGDNVNGVTLHTCSRTAKNEATGEVILVTSNTGDNETVEHIINSIKWGNNTVNATVDSSSSVAPVQNTNNNSDKQFTQEDLDMARDEGYINGYDDSYYDNYYNDYYDDYYESDSSYSSSSESSSSSSDVEITTDD